jgi:hypothetical protein
MMRSTHRVKGVAMNFRLAKVTLITTAAVAFVIVPGIYVVASNAATNMVASFSTTEAASHSNRVAFEAETMRVSAESASAYERCDQGTRKARTRCKAAVRVNEERAFFRSMSLGDARP